MTKNNDMSITEFIVAQLHQPVLSVQKDKDGKVEKKNATDPRDGHELTAKEAIAMKIMQKALSGDVKAAEFVMKQERLAKQMGKIKNGK